LSTAAPDVDAEKVRGPSGASVPVPALRFLLVERLFEAGDGISYWRARESRSGRDRVVRVIDAQPGSHPRWLEQLHRERALADRFDSPQVLRTQVPQVDGTRIVQAVEGAPVRLLRFDGGQRMSALRAALRVVETLAQCHARGHAHGALVASRLLATATGEPLICGFGVAGGSAHDLRQLVARDLWDALDRIAEILAPSGGPPARLRQLFDTGEPLRGMDPMFGMAWLRDELRNALEDTFPWPVVPRDTRPLARPAVFADAAPVTVVAQPDTARPPATAVVPPVTVAPAAAVSPSVVAAPEAVALPAVVLPAIAPAQAAAYATLPSAASPRAIGSGAVRAAEPRRSWWVAAGVVLCLTLLAYLTLDAAPPAAPPPKVPPATSSLGPSSPLELERAVSAALADAEARLRAGEADVARAWFEHALSLDPTNERARDGVKLAAAAIESQQPGPLARLLRAVGVGAP
jgi:hypothetical protein